MKSISGQGGQGILWTEHERDQRRLTMWGISEPDLSLLLMYINDGFLLLVVFIIIIKTDKYTTTRPSESDLRKSSHHNTCNDY